MTRVRLSLIVMGLFLLAVRASGQQPDRRLSPIAPPTAPSASHVPVPLPRGVDLQKLIAERLPQSQPWGAPEGIPAELNQMLQRLKTGDPRAKADVQQRLQQMLQDNPLLHERLSEFARNNPEMLDRMVDGVLRQNPELRGKLDTDALRDRLQRFVPPKQGERQGTGPRPADRTPSRPAPERAPRPAATKSGGDDPAVQQYRDTIARNLSKLADRFDKDRLAPSLRESPAVNHLIERLANTGMEALRSGSAGEGLDAQLARWQRRLEGLRDWVPDRLPEKILDYVPPTLSDVPRPNFRIPRLDFRGAGFGAGRLRTSGGLFDAVQFILFALLLVAIGVVIWRMLATRGAQALGLRRALGPWPLDPARVSSRADLIRAFEYLSLLRCGEKARSWHHRAIAACLGGTEAERRAAAERLAELYEQARYAPLAQALPEQAFTDARRHLTYLAGAGRA